MTTKRKKLKFEEIEIDNFIIMRSTKKRHLILIKKIEKENKQFIADYIYDGTSGFAVFRECDSFLLANKKELKNATKKLQKKVAPINKQIEKLSKALSK